MLNQLRPQGEHERGDVSVALPIAAAVAISLALIGAMVGMAGWGGGYIGMMDGGHMGMMRQGSSGADQTPVASEAEQVTVEMRDFQFFPAKLTVNAGTEVSWVNRDSVPHNAIGEGGAFDTGTVDGGGSVSVVIDRSGSYPYVCTFHPGMEATLTVR